METQSVKKPLKRMLPDVDEAGDFDMMIDTAPTPSLEYLGLGLMEQDLEANKVYIFGRENCDWEIQDQRVSKHHFRIYTVVYDADNRNVLPMLYCEDLESVNGTYVNGRMIGNIKSERVAYLLTDGDIIEIKPAWRFRFHQPSQECFRKEKGKVEDLGHFHDKFVISDRILGEGQYGAVYLAKEITSSRQLACKIVNLKKSAAQLAEESGLGSRISSQCNQDRVKKEIRILASLSHPHIINLRKVFCSETTFCGYIFIDLATAGDLYSYVGSKGDTLPDWHARVIAFQLLRAVSYIHSMGIVHRDIKPENVLLTQADFGGRVILTDFGFANYADKSTGRLMSKLGTPGFIAPEVDFRERLAPQGYTKAADMWSFGMLVAFTLTGQQKLNRTESLLESKQDLNEAVSDFVDIMRHQAHVGRRALGFVQNLLVPEPSQRLTAAQSLDHGWFTRPLSEAAALEKGYQRMTRFWKKRDVDEIVIENIRQNFEAVHKRDEPSVRRRKRLPDATTLPYIGLDRHLQAKMPSTRKQLLADLKGSSFVVDQASFTSSRASVRKRRPQIYQKTKAVDGSNIFGSAGTISASLATTQGLTQDDFDDVDMAQTVDLAPKIDSIYSLNESLELKLSINSSKPRAGDEEALRSVYF